MRTHFNEIEVGWTAYDEEGEELGEAAEIGRNYVLVKEGLLFRGDLYIPASRIDTLDAQDRAFTVTVLKDDAETQGWEDAPTEAADAPRDTDAGPSRTVPYRS